MFSMPLTPNFPMITPPLVPDSFFSSPAFPEMKIQDLAPVKLDVMDLGKNFIVVLPNPHIPLDKIKTHLDAKHHILRLEGQAQNKHDKKDKNSFFSQSSHSAFSHQIQLPPEKVDMKKAHFHIDKRNDLLILTLPKTHPPKKESKL